MSFATFTHRFAAGFAFTIAILLGASETIAQSAYAYNGSPVATAYQPVRAYPVGWGYGEHHASTAAEGFLRGEASVIDALGNYHVNEGQARILREQARALHRVNNLKQTEALLSQKKMWSDAAIQERKDRDARIAEGRRLIEERRATVLSQVYRLPADKLDLTTGAISWPAALRNAKFQENRDRLEELFRQHVGYGKSNADTSREIVRSVDDWTHSLRNDVGSMSREDYLAAQKFLLGLKYGAASLVRPT